MFNPLPGTAPLLCKHQVPCTAFAVYHSQTAPLIDWYKAEGLHHYVKSYGVLEEIFADVCKVVDSL